MGETLRGAKVVVVVVVYLDRRSVANVVVVIVFLLLLPGLNSSITCTRQTQTTIPGWLPSGGDDTRERNVHWIQGSLGEDPRVTLIRSRMSLAKENEQFPMSVTWARDEDLVSSVN